MRDLLLIDFHCVTQRNASIIRIVGHSVTQRNTMANPNFTQKYGEETKPIRVPISKAERIKKLLDQGYDFLPSKGDLSAFETRRLVETLKHRITELEAENKRLNNLFQ